MMRFSISFVGSLLCLASASAADIAAPAATTPATKAATPLAPSSASDNGPHYDADGKLLWPADYREWIFLSSGIDMSYNPLFNMPGHSMFTNVFVNPEAYRAFLADGHWPDRTVLLVEVRGATGKGSINKHGKYQERGIMGLEAHVRDTSRFDGGWGFFSFEGQQPATMIPKAAGCYSCHAEHGAVDTTFVQFYPTLLDLATSKNTLSAGYLKEQAAK
jgi:hypothetical protein